jgi:hypothetical protein
MTPQQAIEKYPNLENMDPLDLVALRHYAIGAGDKDFQEAIDTLLKDEAE